VSGKHPVSDVLVESSLEPLRGGKTAPAPSHGGDRGSL
jgi:hypothetical protein